MALKKKILFLAQEILEPQVSRLWEIIREKHHDKLSSYVLCSLVGMYINGLYHTEVGYWTRQSFDLTWHSCSCESSGEDHVLRALQRCF